MVYYLINCRSLTYAQRAERILERAGITASILRSPQSISGKGCSHSVKVSERRFKDAIDTLRRVSFPFFRIFKIVGEGMYEEVEV